jgi:hypothetical protein
MRSAFALALGATLTVSAPAFAQDFSHVSQALYINGTAPAACVIRGASASGAHNAVFSPIDSARGQITITQFVDEQTAQPRASDIRINLPVTCNAAHRVTVTSTRGGLERAGRVGGGQGGFAEYVPYRIGLDWAGVQRERGSDAGAITVDAANGAAGDLALRVTTPDGGAPLVAGQYDDSIIIAFQPAD